MLQHRADNNFWSTPGGARDYGESYREAALREASEEISLPLNCTQGPNPLIVIRHEVALLDHSVWKYVTVIADVVGDFVPRRRPGDTESHSVEWVPIDQVGRGRFFPLLPAFWEAWPQLLEILRQDESVAPAPTEQPGPAPTEQPGPAPTEETVLADEDDKLPGEAPVPGPFDYFSDSDEDDGLGTELQWLPGQENLCLWFIPAMP